MDILQALGVGVAAVTIFGGAQFLVALTIFSVMSLAERARNHRRARRILNAEAEHRRMYGHN